jgi:hypothetical protein
MILFGSKLSKVEERARRTKNEGELATCVWQTRARLITPNAIRIDQPNA